MIEVPCRRCGRQWQPTRDDFRRGAWQLCPGCRGGPSGDERAAQRPNTPDATTGASAATTARQGDEAA